MQIARIAHSTTIIPKGLYKLVEDSETRDIEEFVPEEGELQMPSTHDMAKAENWVHYTQNILFNGRLNHMDPEVPEGEDIDPEVLKKQIEAADPYEPRLKPVSQDKPVLVAEKAKQEAWVVRLMGDKNEY